MSAAQRPDDEKPQPIRDVPPGLRKQLDAPSYMGPSTFGMRPLLTEPEQLAPVIDEFLRR